jgi:hypothetical protein
VLHDGSSGRVHARVVWIDHMNTCMYGMYVSRIVQYSCVCAKVSEWQTVSRRNVVFSVGQYVLDKFMVIQSKSRRSRYERMKHGCSRMQNVSALQVVLKLSSAARFFFNQLPRRADKATCNPRVRQYWIAQTELPG